MKSTFYKEESFADQSLICCKVIVTVWQIEFLETVGSQRLVMNL